MAKTRSMARSHNLNARNTKRINICDKGVVSPWSNLNHDVLFLVMMQLGVIDFVAFSGVCKSWRSLARSNRNYFMSSKPPMSIWISKEAAYCYLKDFQGRKFKTILPHSTGKTCHGITCGYLILFKRQTNDFWLVNPITRHQLHFPNVPLNVSYAPAILRGILVFSPSISEWIFIIINRFHNKIWFSIGGQGAWNRVPSTFRVVDIHVFKGKIYTLHISGLSWELKYLCEMRLDPQPKLTLLKTNNFPERYLCWDFISLEDNLYLTHHISKDSCKVVEIDLSEMKWVLNEKITNEYSFFISSFEHSTVIKPESWADPWSQHERWADTNTIGKGRFLIADMWYFPNDCLNVNRIHEC